jgi:cytochrome c oxidase subunit 2
VDFIRSFIESYLPPNYSSHGHHVDNLIVWTHYLMFVLFVGWGIYFIYTLFKFRESNNDKASYKGVTSHYSTYVEGGVILFEAFLIFALALPKWQDLKINIEKPQNIPIKQSVYDLRENFLEIEGVEQDDISTFFPDNEINKDKQVIHVISQAFNYNVHYPGPDGKFGPRHRHLVNDGEGEYIGLDWNHPDSKDDIVLLDELILEVGKPVLIYLTSKDVIHSFFLPEFRVKQDAIPGQRVAIFFTPEITTQEFLEGLGSGEKFSLWDWIADPENYDYDYLDFNQDGSSINFSSQRGELLPEKYGRDTFQLGCAQLCGSGHAAMNKGDMFIVTSEEYQQWYFGQMWAKNSIIVEDEEWGDDW